MAYREASASVVPTATGSKFQNAIQHRFKPWNIPSIFLARIPTLVARADASSIESGEMKGLTEIQYSLNCE